MFIALHHIIILLIVVIGVISFILIKLSLQSTLNTKDIKRLESFTIPKEDKQLFNNYISIDDRVGDWSNNITRNANIDGDKNSVHL